MKRVILFSGGRTSGYMLRRLIDSNGGIDDCTVIFCNTGKERKETLDFVHRVQTMWEIPIVMFGTSFTCCSCGIKLLEFTDGTLYHPKMDNRKGWSGKSSKCLLVGKKCTSPFAFECTEIKANE